MDVLFPISQYWSFYLFFTLGICTLLLLDLGIFHRKCHVVTFKESAIWTLIWVGLGLTFNLFLYKYAQWKFTAIPNFESLWNETPNAAATRVGLEFLAGFIVEKSLAIDNIFVFVVIFTFFGIPAQYQHRVLFYGIIGALIFRAIFIALGSVLLSYQWVVIFFGAILIITGIKMFFAPKKEIDPSKNILLKMLKRYLPIHPQIEGERFFVKHGGKILVTPLFMALLFVEFSDILFAVDSVPAIFAITKEPLIVFASNILAILGLRSLYFLLAGAYERFHLLKYGLGIVLCFVGLKMVYLNELYGGKFPISLSLGFILTVLTGSIVASLLIGQSPAKQRT